MAGRLPFCFSGFLQQRNQAGKPVTELEVDMQDKAKSITDGMMQKASDKLHWPMSTLEELVNNSRMQDGTTPPELRSSRRFGIVYQFIVSKDSLNVWRQWLTDFADRRKASTLGYVQHRENIVQGPEYKRYHDSAMHYLKLETDFLSSKKTNMTEAEQKKMEQYGKKQNQYLDKANALISDDNLEDYDAEETTKTNDFKNATVVQVYFMFNMAGAGMENTNKNQKEIKNISLPGAKVSRLIHFSPRDVARELWNLDSWDNRMTILSGNWIANPESPKYDFVAAFSQKKGQNNEHSPKMIKSYKVQTISIHIQGSKSNIATLAGQLDIDELNSLLVK